MARQGYSDVIQIGGTAARHFENTFLAVASEEVPIWGGSISAEHGIGRAKASWMATIDCPAHLAALR